jgi:hypothetical protein
MDLSLRVSFSGNKCEQHAAPEYLAPPLPASTRAPKVVTTGNVSSFSNSRENLLTSRLVTSVAAHSSVDSRNAVGCCKSHSSHVFNLLRKINVAILNPADLVERSFPSPQLGPQSGARIPSPCAAFIFYRPSSTSATSARAKSRESRCTAPGLSSK